MVEIKFKIAAKAGEYSISWGQYSVIIQSLDVRQFDEERERGTVRQLAD